MYGDLNLPNYPIKTKSNPSGLQVFDAVRNKWVAYTPEEHVRQQFVQHLIHGLGYASSRLAIEKGFTINRRQKRWDIAYHNRSGHWRVLVEVKAAHVPINQAVIDQVAQYNMALQIPYIIITNGLQHYCFYLDADAAQYRALKDLPSAGQVE